MRIGVRGSDLALAYASAATMILEHKSFIDVEIVVIKTDGDIHQDVPIHEIGGKAVFCSAIETALLNGDIDVAVHSLKDMPADVEVSELEISAVLERRDPRDCVIGNMGINAKVGTGSPRRTAQLKILNPYIQVSPIRGNIDTRIAKLDAGEYDAIILAVSGLETLGLEHRINKIFNIDEMLPAIGQGVIALQTVKDSEASQIIKTKNHLDTYYAAMAERRMLKVIDGDCHTAIGCISSVVGDCIMLQAHNYETGKHGSVIGKKLDYLKLGESLGVKLI